MCVGRETDPLEDRIRLIRAQNEQIRKRQLEIEADKLQYAWQSLSPSCYISSTHHQFTTFDVKYIKIIKNRVNLHAFLSKTLSLFTSQNVYTFSIWNLLIPTILFFSFLLLFFWNHCVLLSFDCPLCFYEHGHQVVKNTIQ